MTTATVTGDSIHPGREFVDLLRRYRTRALEKRSECPLDGRSHRDRYDTAEAKYVVMTDDFDRVVAAARLLPTTGPYPLPDLFPQLLGDRAAPRDPTTWDLSRLTASVTSTRDGRALTLSERTLELLELVFDLARRHEVCRLVLVAPIGIERLMLRAKLDAHRFGPPGSVDGELCVALFIEVPLEARAANRPHGSAPKRLRYDRVLQTVDAAEPLAALLDSHDR